VDLSGLKALLIDLEGTVYEAGRVVAGAPEAIEALRRRGVRCLFVTNTTSRPRRRLVAELAGMGISVRPEDVFTAPLAGRQYLLDRGWTRCDLMVRTQVLEDFAGIEQEHDHPSAVVMGDIGDEFTFERLNRAFHLLLLEGAELVTLARNRYYRSAEGLILDQGPFVAALEHASGKSAKLVGKPSADFFRAALESLGVTPGEAAVVGDDIQADVGGGMAFGMRGILVRTGKFRSEELRGSSSRPDAVVDSVADLPGLL
jgi:HAD superfamily hydrolase (TIGR01458 family)